MKRLITSVIITIIWAVGAIFISGKLQTCAQSLPANFDASGHLQTIPPSSWSHMSIVHLCPADQGIFSQTDFLIQLSYLFIIPFIVTFLLLSFFRKR